MNPFFSCALIAALAAASLDGALARDDAQAPSTGVVVAPVKRSLKSLPVEALGPGVTRQLMHGTQTTISRWDLKAGSGVPMHHHPNEQITMILSGRSEVTSGGETLVMEAGDIMIFPPNAPHEFKILEDTIALDFFAPARQDWIDAAVKAAQ